MSGQSGGSSAPSATEKQSNASGTTSWGHDQARSETENEAPLRAVLDHDGHPYRRHKPRSSGGFLLQTTAPPIEPDNIRDVKGKRKAEEGALFVPKRSSPRQRQRQKPSLGSSPLATEVVNVHSHEHEHEHGASDGGKRSSVHSHSMPSNLNSNESSSGSAASKDPAKLSHGKNAIGHDTDAAQIVNLALNLSESRRRNFTSGGLLIPRDTVGARRIISSGQQTLALPNGVRGESLRQHLQNQRQVSRSISPRSGSSSSHKGSRYNSPHSQKEQTGKRLSTLLPDFRATVADDLAFEASDATLSRAEKARVAIELMYEYRRLLQYLPPIPMNSKRKLATSKDSAKHQIETSTDLGRTYNPLQYIRNRKVRFRERRPLDPEAAGWKDLDRVRTWVNIVASEREDGISRIDRRFPLPSLDTARGEYALAGDLRNASAPNLASPQSRKVGRPRMDWVFAGSDLLADAYWLNEGDNLDHIEDHWGRKINADHPDLKAHISRASIESSRSSVRRSESIVREHASPDRVRVLAGHSRKDSKDRGRRSLDVQEPRSPVSEDNGSRDRKSRWPRKLIRSRSSSDSDDSHQESHRRQKRGRDYARSYENIESAALEKQMMDMLAKEAEAGTQVDQSLEEDAGTRADPDTRPNGGAMRDRLGQQYTKRRPNAPQRMKTDFPVTTKHTLSARASLDDDRLHHHRLSLDNLELTAPNTPMTPVLVPSIAINLSAPASPPSTVSSPNKTLTSRIGSSPHGRSRSVDRRATDEIDQDSSGTTDLSRQTTNQSQSVNMLRKERSTTSTNGLLALLKSEAASNKHRSLDGNSIRNIKNATGSDSRRRGFFKGGRIAELVGSEVSRVGDMFWRKDNEHAVRVGSPASSYAASEESDLEDGDWSGLDNSPKHSLSRATTKDDEDLSKMSPSIDKPKYYMSNLPTFRSSINRDEHSPKFSKSSQYQDHITRQQLAQRERGRSSRFERLAPPRIDMIRISAPSSRESSPFRSQSERTNNEDSRQSSSSRSDHGVHSADRRLNEMLGIPGKAGTGLAPPTGLAGLDSKRRESSQRRDLQSKRHWSISDRDVSTVRGTMNKRDVARVRALLLSSGVKANEIARRAEEVPEKPSAFLQDLEHIFNGPISDVPRSKEPLFAAKILINNVETNIQGLRDKAEYFSNATIKNLHDRIKAIDEHVTYKLTPLVRTSADDADSFSTELTTTHTLAIKQLNDSIDVILRRRRRRLRNVRRTGWAMVEWTLLGIMWIVWMIVVIVRLVRGTVGCMFKALRWLFWL